MNKIGILGKNSYIGTSLQSYIKADCIETRNDAWKKYDFSQYNSLICTVGIAHVSSDPSMEALYYQVNRDLPVELAKKAKNEGVKQFVFLSSMIIYGEDVSISQTKVITSKTDPSPANFYGNSKLQAEQLLLELQTENFKILIIRLPMVYGQNCKGNFPSLVKLAKKTLFFPKIENKRSMIYIDNFCLCVKNYIEQEKSGIAFLQNKDYVSTDDIIKQIAKYYNRHIFFISFFNPLLKFLSNKIKLINKVFGNKVYDKSLTPDVNVYNKYSFEESIKRTLELTTTW